ncbi:DUF1659 domain-containing protein [Lysinibacillus sp. 54212]|uniref:DUF1659 domain-containing protein n=1 Tax=Lysinibacillus sp. 54212 TaxID=3119829 RepID=UPI002FCBDE2D
MAAYQFQSASLVLSFDAGVNEENKPIVKKATYRNVKEQASATELAAVATALGSLSELTLIDVEKTQKETIA